MSDNITTLEAITEASSNAAALLAAGGALGDAKTHPTADAVPYAVVPEGYVLEKLPTADLPLRPNGNVRLRDTASFVRFYKDHAADFSRIYATLEPARFQAVFDETRVVTFRDEHLHDQANWRQFRATFEVPPSREWKLWTSTDRMPMNQLQFASFLEDNLPDVVKPDGADLLQLALNFEAAQAGSFVATQRLQDGSHNLQWKSENNASGTVRLPEQITISIPVFENAEPQQIDARLRYRIKEGVLTIWYELIRPHKVLEATFRSAWATIAEQTGAAILLGTPE